MRHWIVILIFVFAATSMLASEGDTSRVTRDTMFAGSTPSAKLFPTIAKNQTRPLRLITESPDPDVLDPPDGGGGWTQGGCNCKRNCRNAGTQCKLISDVAQGCKYTANLVCEDCMSCVP